MLSSSNENIEIEVTKTLSSCNNLLLSRLNFPFPRKLDATFFFVCFLFHKFTFIRMFGAVYQRVPGLTVIVEKSPFKKQNYIRIWGLNLLQIKFFSSFTRSSFVVLGGMKQCVCRKGWKNYSC